MGTSSLLSGVLEPASVPNSVRVNASLLSCETSNWSLQSATYRATSSSAAHAASSSSRPSDLDVTQQV